MKAKESSKEQVVLELKDLFRKYIYLMRIKDICLVVRDEEIEERASKGADSYFATKSALIKKNRVKRDESSVMRLSIRASYDTLFLGCELNPDVKFSLYGLFL